MSEMQPWLGMCHLTKQEGETQESYQAIAAVLCSDRETYDKLLHKFLEPKGYRLLWSEEVHPAGQWISRFPQERSAAGLARAVHPQHLIEISILKAIGNKGGYFGQATYLTTTEYEILPLPDQSDLPFWDREWITDELKDLLFGQPEEGERLRTYFIVDAALRKNITGLFDLDSLDVPTQCLFKGDTAEELKEVAPYLIDMTLPEEAWGNKDKTPAFHKDFFANHWDQNTGIFVRTSACMADVRGHFRKFIRIPDHSGKIVYFRFWVPTTFCPMSGYLGGSKEFGHVFFSDFVKFICFNHPHKNKLMQYAPKGPLLKNRKFVIESLLEERFVSYVRYMHGLRLMDDIETTLREKEPELSDLMDKTSRSKKFGVAQKLYKMKVLDTLQASAIMSITYRTGINMLREKAFDYATKNPFLSPNAKARQLILGFAAATNSVNGEK